MVVIEPLWEWMLLKIWRDVRIVYVILLHSILDDVWWLDSTFDNRMDDDVISWTDTYWSLWMQWYGWLITSLNVWYGWRYYVFDIDDVTGDGRSLRRTQHWSAERYVLVGGGRTAVQMGTVEHCISCCVQVHLLTCCANEDQWWRHASWWTKELWTTRIYGTGQRHMNLDCVWPRLVWQHNEHSLHLTFYTMFAYSCILKSKRGRAPVESKRTKEGRVLGSY